MTEPKMITFGGTSNENIEHFLYGFQIYFQKAASQLADNQAEETSQAKAYYVMRHIKPGSAASKFVNRLPLDVTRDYAALCQELRSRFENSTELEEEKRRAEESFLSLRQKSSQSIRGYIKLTRKIASRMSNENQHLVATQFIKGLDSRELRIQAMSGLSNRPGVEEAITKVQRLWDVMGEDESSGDENDSELTDSETESDEHEPEGRSRSRRGYRKRDTREDKKRRNKEQKALREAGRIRKELEELKQLLTKHQGSSYGQGLPKPISITENQELLAVEAYTMGNRLAPPVNYYGPEPRTSYPRYYSGREGRSLPLGERYTTERADGPQWGQARQLARPWQGRSSYAGNADPTNNIQPNDFSQYPVENRIPYQRRDRSHLVCYQCGIVGHLRYECHLLPQPVQVRDMPPVLASNQYTQDQSRTQAGEREIGKEGEGQERHRWGARMPANREAGVVRQSSAVNGMVVELIHPVNGHRNDSDTSEDSTINQSGEIDRKTQRRGLRDSKWVEEFIGEEGCTSAGGNQSSGSAEVMAGEKARLRSELTESSGSQEGQPPRRRLRSQVGQNDTTQPREQRRLPTKHSGRRPIRLMAGRPGFDFVSGFRDTQVTGLTWGQFFDLSPEGKRQFVKLMVQERPRSKGAASKGKGKAEARVVESILSEVALVGRMEPNLEVTNFYTTARICMDGRTFTVDHVLIDAGSVVNLAPITVLQAIGAPLMPTKDLVIRTAASNLVPLDFYADLKVEVASVVTPLRVFAMPKSCEPTYGLLLSRRWLRVCQAVGDYAEDVYVIKDGLGREHKVPREGRRSLNGQRPKVCIRPGITQSRLDEDLIAELELDKHKSFEEMVRQIMSEARTELAVFEALEGYEEDYGLTESEDLGMEEDTEESETGYYSDRSGEASEAENEERDTGTKRKDRKRLVEKGCSASAKICNDPKTTRKKSGKKKVRWADEEIRGSGKKKQYEQESFGTFGKENDYFYGEVGNWVTKRLASPKWRAVGSEELWRWSMGRLEDKVKGDQYGGREKDHELEIGPAEQVLEYLKRRVSRTTSTSPLPTIYNLCQRFYEGTKGQIHSDGGCEIKKCVLCKSEKVYMEQRGELELKSEEEEKLTTEENWGAGIGLFETSEVGVGEEIGEEANKDREGVDDLDEVFGQAGGYPTTRRPFQSRREIDNISSIATVDEWYEKSKIRLGCHATGKVRDQAKRILYTWRDLFVSKVNEMPTTDLVCHYIPTWPGSIPVRARDKLYTQEESAWMDEKIPEMLAAGIIEHAVSPWSHRTKFVRKKDKGLRMVHVFCPINSATINHSYPMKRIEPVINNLSQARYKVYLQVDAANGFWAVLLYPPHSYKTAFSTSLGQFQYKRMGQGLSGAPQTYSRLKDLVAGPIPAPFAEPALNRVSCGSFEHFIDDDFAAHGSPAAQLEFMHYWYFPRLSWAQMTLKPSKSGFLLDTIEPLGFQTKGQGLRPSLDKVCAIREYPTPTNQEELERFLYMTTYLRYFIPGRADHARIIKKAIIYKEEAPSRKSRGGNALGSRQTNQIGKQKKEGQVSKETRHSKKARKITEVEKAIYTGGRQDNGRDSEEVEETVARVMIGDAGFWLGTSEEGLKEGGKLEEGVGTKQQGKKSKRGKGTKIVVGFEWGLDQQRSFDHMKRAIISNAVYGGDARQQYHLSTDASKSGLGGVLFQLINLLPGTIASPKNRKNQRIIMFISKPFTGAEVRYSTTEREALAVVRCLEEVRWLVLGSAFPTKVYTDHQALVKLLQKDDAHGRIARWQVRLSEYDVEYIHIPGTQNTIADGLSRLEELKASTKIEVCGIDSVGKASVGGLEDGKGYDTRLDGWEEWLDEDWYAPVVRYKLTGSLDGIPGANSTLGKSRNVRRVLRRSAQDFLLVLATPTIPRNRLLYRERNGELSSCVKSQDIGDILYRLHDCHGHFAAGLLLKLTIGRYYWPTRVRDIHTYCRTCTNCQLVGPFKPSAGHLPILQLQPFDMLGMDFIGPITPVTTPSSYKYIVIAVDYFSRFLFAAPVTNASGECAVSLLLEQIVRPFGWPGSLYTDNGPHFVSGVFARLLQENLVHHFPAPKTHPSSVGLSERYVQILMTGLRTTIIQNRYPIERWSECVPTVVQAINVRQLSVQGYSPAQLLFGFNPRTTGFGKPTARDEIVLSALASLIVQAPERTIYDYELQKIDYNIRLACLDESRNIALYRALEHTTAMERGEGRWQQLQEGDLVLLRRFEVDKHKGKKLEALWEGPYLLGDLSWHGRTGRLIDIQSGKVVRVRKGGLRERCHLDDMKLFVPFDAKVLGKGRLRGIHGMTARLREEGEEGEEMELPEGINALGRSEVTFVEFEKLDSWLGLTTGELCDLMGLWYW